jgi:hypothetical protein
MDDIDQWLDAPIGSDVPDLKNQDEVDQWLDAPAPAATPKLNQADIDAFLDAPADDTGSFMRGFKGALQQQLPEDIASAIEGIGALTGLGEEIVQPDGTVLPGTKIPEYLRNLSKSGVQYKRQVPSFADIKNLGDVGTYIAESAGSGAGSTVPSLVTGTVGGYIGSRATKSKYGAIGGSMAGAALPSAAQNFGSLYSALLDEGVPREKAAEYAAAASAPIVALDVAAPVSWISRLTGDARREALRGLAKRIAQEAAKGFAVESATEAAQTGIEKGTISAAADKPLFTAENVRDIADAFIQGGLGGGTMGGVSGVAPDRAAPVATPTEQAAPVTAAPVDVGATVGLQTPGGPVRVRVEGTEGGNVFYTTPDGVTLGMPAEDFSAATVEAPQPADAIRGDATTVPQPPAAVTEYTDYGDINDFDPNAPAERPAPAAPSPQQAMQLPDTTAVDRAAAAAREFRKAAVAATDAERASYLNSQADALDNEAMNLRRQLAARSDVGGVGVPAADVRARADLGRLGESAPAVSEAQTGPVPVDTRQPQTPLERAAPAVSEAVTGPVPQTVVAPDTRTELERAAPAVRPPEQPVTVKPKPTVEQMVNNRSARLNDPQEIARQTGKTVEEVRAELNRIAGRPNSPIRQVRGKVTIDPKTKQPVQSARAGAYMYLTKRTTPMSILEALSASGGVQDRGGDLASMGADTWHRGKPGKRSLVNERGIAWGELGDWAEREGYLAPRPVDETTGENYHRDPSEVLAMIDRELRGQKQLPLGEVAEQEAMPEPTADERREHAVRSGLERLQETPAPDATLDEMEAQLTERLAMMNAATVDEAVDMVNAELDALDRIMEDTYAEQWQPDIEARAGAAEAVSETAGRPEDVGTREGAGAARDVDREQAAGRAAEEDGGVGLGSEAARGKPGVYADYAPDFAAYLGGRTDKKQAAAEWVFNKGLETGHEYVVAIDGAGNVIGAGTSNENNSVGFSDEMHDLMNVPGAKMDFIHNHPTNSTVSQTDISVLGRPGVRAIFAMGANNLGSAVGLKVPVAIDTSQITSPQFSEIIRQIAQAAYVGAVKSISVEPSHGNLSANTLVELTGIAMNQGIASAGLTVFSHNYQLNPMLAGVLARATIAAKRNADEAIAYAKDQIRGPAGRQQISGGSQEVLDGERSDRVQRGADRQEAEAAGDQAGQADLAERASGAAGRPILRSEGANESVEENRVTITSILDRFRRGPRTAKQAARATTNAVRNVKGPPELRKLSAIGNLISFAATVASKDTISARYYTAEKAMARYAEALTRQGARDAAAYFSDQVGPSGREKINKILEHDRLQGLNRQDTGKRIVARMPDTYRGQLAKPGEIVTLNAVESRALMEMRQFFDTRWDQFGAAMAKQFGWDGPFTEDALNAAVRDADSVRSQNQATRALEIFRMVQDMRRVGYVPFARYGDTKISIRPKPKAVPGKDAMQFERPVHVELVSTKSITDTILDQTVSDDDGPAAIRRRRKELEKDYPRDQYDYDVTPLNTISDLRKVDLPAVEKMFMLINMKNPEMGPAFYEQIVNEIFEQRKAGFRKQSNNIPGYSTDFERGIADYIHQTSSVIARMELGKDVNLAYEATQKHQDKDIAEFWKDYREYVEKPGDDFSGMRKIAFWSFIWGSPASAIINLTQTPLVTIPQTAAWAGPRTVDVIGAALIDAASAIRAGRDGLVIDWTKLGKTPAEKRMIAQLREEGVLDPVIARDLQGYDRGTSPTNRKWRRRFDRAYDIGASAFNAAEMTNRIAAALGAFRLAQNPMALKKAQAVYSQDAEFRQMVGRNGTPMDMARFMVDETQFMGGKRGRPRVMRGAGSLILQWKQYQANWLRLMFKNMTRMGPEGKLAGTAMLLSLVATAGLLGIPFAEDALDAANWMIKKVTGIDPLLERRMARWLRDAGLGEVGAEVAMHGPSREYLGVDLGSRIGMGEMTPDGSIENAFPLLGATVGKLGEVWDRATSGQPLGAAATLLPKGAADVVKAVSVLPEEGYRTKRGDINLFPHEITAGQQLARFFGLQPAAFSRKSEYKYAQREMAAATQEASTKLLTNVAAELALATQAKQYEDEKAYRRHVDRYTSLLRENAEQLMDKDLPGWMKIPQPAARAIKARLQQIMNFDQAILKRSGKMKRESLMDYPLPTE